MKKINLILKISFVLVLVFCAGVVYAEGESVNFILKNNGVEVYSGEVALPAEGLVDVNDTDEVSHSVNARSVLNIVYNADALSPAFNISSLIYYESFGAFYLKCIDVDGSDLCDTWMYKVDDTDPGMGMDQMTLSGGENVVLFFGDEDPAPIPEPTIEPAPEPAKEEEPAKSSSHGSVATGSYPTRATSESATPPVITVATPPPPQKQIIKVTPKKTIKKVEVQAEASVIGAMSDNNNVIQPPEGKRGWFRSFLGWLFGF